MVDHWSTSIVIRSMRLIHSNGPGIYIDTNAPLSWVGDARRRRRPARAAAWGSAPICSTCSCFAYGPNSYGVRHCYLKAATGWTKQEHKNRVSACVTGCDCTATPPPSPSPPPSPGPPAPGPATTSRPVPKPAAARGSKPISVGTIALIVFFTSMVFYLVVGATVKHRQQGGQSGRLIELIPNHEFWANCIGLVATGCMFTFRRTRHVVGTPSGYGDYDQL